MCEWRGSLNERQFRKKRTLRFEINPHLLKYFCKTIFKRFKKRYQKDALYLINIKKKMMVQKKDILTQNDKNKNKIT